MRGSRGNGTGMRDGMRRAACASVGAIRAVRSGARPQRRSSAGVTAPRRCTCRLAWGTPQEACARRPRAAECSIAEGGALPLLRLSLGAHEGRPLESLHMGGHVYVAHADPAPLTRSVGQRLRPAAIAARQRPAGARTSRSASALRRPSSRLGPRSAGPPPVHRDPRVHDRRDPRRRRLPDRSPRPGRTRLRHRRRDARLMPAPHRHGGDHDAVVVGSGPNGLAAAIVARARGASVLVLEGADTLGGGTRTGRADASRASSTTSARRSTPLGARLAVPAQLPLDEHGLESVHPRAPLAHPLDDGTAAILERSVDATADAPRRRRRALPAALFGPLVDARRQLIAELLGPLRPPAPSARARALRRATALLPADGARALALPRRARAGAVRRAARRTRCCRSTTPGQRRRSGSCSRRPRTPSAGRSPRGGSQALADALAAHLRSLGGEVETGARVALARRRCRRRAPVLLDVTPRAVARASPAPRCPAATARRLARLPLRARRLQARLGARRRRSRGGAEARARRDRPPRRHARGDRRRRSAPVARGQHADAPFVLLAQPSRFDPTRAPDGKPHRLGLLPRPERLDRAT